MARVDSDSQKCPLVLVEWEDSAQPVPGWVRLADFEAPRIVSCASVGWLIHDGSDVKALAPNMGDFDDAAHVQASGIIRIPARTVTRIIRLGEQGNPIFSCEAPLSRPGSKPSRTGS